MAFVSGGYTPYLVAGANAESDEEIARVETSYRHAEPRVPSDARGPPEARLRPGLSPERADHLVVMYASPNVYHVLVDAYR
jgi:hypothetical protein